MPLGLLVYPSINLLMNFPLGSLRFACQQALVYVACTNVLLLKSEWNEEKGSTKRRAMSQDSTVIRPPWSIGRTVRTIPDDLSVGVIAIGWQQVLKGSLHAGIPMDGKCRQDDSDNNRHDSQRLNGECLEHKTRWNADHDKRQRRPDVCQECPFDGQLRSLPG